MLNDVVRSIKNDEIIVDQRNLEENITAWGQYFVYWSLALFALEHPQGQGQG